MNAIPLDAIKQKALAMAKTGLKVAIDSLSCGACHMNTRMLDISFRGEVYPCSFVRRSLGNAFREPVRQIWARRGGQEKCPFL